MKYTRYVSTYVYLAGEMGGIVTPSPINFGSELAGNNLAITLWNCTQKEQPCGQVEHL